MAKVNRTREFRIFSIIICIAAFVLGFSAGSWGEVPAPATIETTTPQKMHLTAGKSTVIRTHRAVKRVSIASPHIADAIVLTPRQIYLTGKTPGLTNMTLWEDESVATVFDIEVSPDVTRLKEKLHEAFPEETNISVTTSNDQIMLSGTVSSAPNLERVMAIAESFAPCFAGKNKGKDQEGEGEKAPLNAQGTPASGKEQCTGIINMLEVSGVQQVMLEVRVAEVSRSLLNQLGINFNFISDSGRTFGVSTLSNLTSVREVYGNPVENLFKLLPGWSALLPTKGFPVDPVQVSSSVNMLLRFLNNNGTWTGFIDALKENGIVSVLAEPTLITLSGQNAHFLAGGEYPIPVPQSFGVTTIDYKSYGVGLNFTPIVLNNGKISMKVSPEVSDLDFTNAVILSGYVVPAIKSRRVSTTIELGDGQSFAIAGLISDDIREIVSKFPLLGDIPIIGPLFRSSSFQKRQTELIVIATPHLVKPLDMAKQTLPTDQFIEPNDLEFFLLGRMEGAEKKETPGAAPSAPSVPRPGNEGKLEGNFGHIIPK